MHPRSLAPAALRKLTPRELAHHRWLARVGALIAAVGLLVLALGAACSLKMGWSWSWVTPGLVMIASGGLFAFGSALEAESRKTGWIAVDDFSTDD